MNRVKSISPIPPGRTKSEIVTVTPEVAAHWLEQYNYSRQRHIRERHVQNIAKAIVDGDFEITTLQFRHVDGERVMLVDGQHRLHAILLSGKPLELNVLHRGVESDEQVGRAYQHLDVGLYRHVAERLAASNLDVNLGLTMRQINKLGAAVPILNDGFQLAAPQFRSRNIEERIAGIQRWAGEMREVVSLVSAEHPQPMWRKFEVATVLSFVLVTFRHQPEKAREFWGDILNARNLENEPKLRAYEFLFSTNYRRMSANEVARKLATAWNAFMQEQALEDLTVRAYNRQRPVKIVGTPYNGRDVVRDGEPTITALTQEAGEGTLVREGDLVGAH